MSAIQYPVADPIPDGIPLPLDEPQIEPAPAPSRRFTRRQVGRAARIVTLAATAAVVGAVVASMMRPADPAVAAPTATVPDQIGGFAEMAVTAYLANGHAGNEATIEPFYSVPLDLTGIPPGQWYVMEAATVQLEPIAADLYSATVAVDLLGAMGEEYVALGVQYFQIPVRTTGDWFTAAGLPSRADAPQAVNTPRPVGELSPPTGSDFDVAVQGFLSGYLTGHGDIDLYTAPDTSLSATTAPPYAEVILRRVGVEHAANDGFLAVAEFVGIDETGRRVVSEARLVVDAQWRVVAVLAGLPEATP